MHIDFFSQVRNQLGESPLWDPRRNCLWWVDIAAKKLMAANLDGHLIADWHFDKPVSSVGLSTDGLIASMADGFAKICSDGGLRYLDRPAIGEGAIRFNDGKADRAGRFLAGTMQTELSGSAKGTIWQLAPGHSARQVVGDIRLSNALCFSPDGEWMYFADSMEGVLRRCAYDSQTGDVGVPEILVDLRPYGSVPDGATVDSEGGIWVALVQAQAIARFSDDGRLDFLIDLPVPYPSCPAFGGERYETLFITTISDSGHRLKTEHPDGGRIVRIGDTRFFGLAEGVFCGFNSKPQDNDVKGGI